MKTPTIALIFIAAAACSPPAQQQATTEAPAENAEATTTPAPAVDPAATAALERMSAYLRTLQNFEVRSRTSMDEVLVDTDQKVQFAGEGVYRVRRPNAFYLEANTDRKHRRFYYDGHNFTIYSPRMKLYAQAPAPATIHEMVDQMQDHYGIPVPLADLFYWGAEPTETPELASRIGFARINGQDSDHYAFRRGDIDWQIWIARGDRPLPLKVIVTTRSMPEQPQFTSELTWNLHPRFSNDTFAFRAPSDAHAIALQGPL